jgi:UDP-N-acetylglucosamine:LPS N-acetylglucosamine transferase
MGANRPFPAVANGPGCAIHSAPMKRIEFVFFDAGGGHRAAATALKLAIESRGIDWDIHLMNLQDELDKLDILRRLTGIRIQEAYNWMLRSGWTLGSAQILRLLQATIWVHHKLLLKLLRNYWRKTAPDMVVSFVPHFNRLMGESYAIEFPGRPMVTILTDLANYFPDFWMERREQYFICGTDLAEQQALKFTGAPERVFRVSGMILHPRFYEPQTADRAAGRTALGLDPKLPTGLVLFGGYGSGNIERIVDRLDKTTLPVQLILICGRNEKLRARLAARKTRLPIFVEGFTTNIPYYMHLSDFFIGKPGPGSVSEAIQMKLPVIVECNAWTLPQERYNATWVTENQVGIAVKNFRQIVPAVEQLLSDATLDRYRANAAALPNRAVFEIPDILQQILERSTAAPAPLAKAAECR